MGKLSHGGLGGPGKVNPALLSFGMGRGDKSGCQLSAWRREKGPETLGVETDPKSDGIRGPGLQHPPGNLSSLSGKGVEWEEDGDEGGSA